MADAYDIYFGFKRPVRCSCGAVYEVDSPGWDEATRGDCKAATQKRKEAATHDAVTYRRNELETQLKIDRAFLEGELSRNRIKMLYSDDGLFEGRQA